MKSLTAIGFAGIVSLLIGCATSPIGIAAKGAATQKSGKTSLMYAAERGDLTNVIHWIQQGADINARCDAFRTSKPVNAGTSGVTVWSARRSASGEWESPSGKRNAVKEGNSALSLAILNRHVEVVQYLVEHGADAGIRVVYQNGEFHTPPADVNINYVNPSDFWTVEEREATILELATMTQDPRIIEIIQRRLNGQK